MDRLSHQTELGMNAAFKFSPAVREQISLIIGLAGGAGSGKTKSAMRLAAGMSGGKRFAVIDSEAGRAKHYAEQHAFDHGDLHPPFRPEAYSTAILAADAAGYPVIVVDSCSHEWAGEGGILDWQEEELQRMAGDDWKKREACKMAAWIRPKMAHKKMVQRLLQIRAHLILCFRAEEKIDMVRDPADGKMKIVPKVSRAGLDGWIPICEKTLPFELTSSFLLTADAPGVPKPIKLYEQHRSFVSITAALDESTGKLLAKWAAGAPAPADTIEQLLADYSACTTSARFAALELRRGNFWTKSTSVESKASLSAASKAAKARSEVR
jgi:AAA domain-containing protein